MRIRQTLVPLIAATAAALPVPLAADGVVDPTFGSGGYRRILWDQGGSYTDRGRVVAVQPDGRIVVAGYYQVQGGGFLMGLVRLLPHGALDPGFGTGGRVFLGVSANEDATGLAFGADGSIYLAGSYGGYEREEGWPTLRWLDGSGSYLGGIGIQSAHISYPGRARLATTADGRLLLAYSASTFSSAGTDFVVRRYWPDLTLDSSFGSSGQSMVAFDLGDNFNDPLAQVLVQPDGKIVLAGSAEYASFDMDIAVTRLASFGVIDACCFGNLGRSTVALDQVPGGYDAAHDAALQSDGRIVVVGQTEIAGGNFAGFVIRFRVDGTFDQQFGIRLLLPGWAGSSILRGVAVQSDGKIVVVGETTKFLPHRDDDFFAARLLPDGRLDPTFNGSGVVGIPFPSSPNSSAPSDLALGVALQGGRAVIAGTSEWSGADSDFAVTRLDSALIFSDGFERGSIGAWSSGLP